MTLDVARAQHSNNQIQLDIDTGRALQEINIKKGIMYEYKFYIWDFPIPDLMGLSRICHVMSGTLNVRHAI